MPISAEKGT